MKPVLTSFIKETSLDHAALSDRFEIACISYQSWSDVERKTNLAALPKRIYRSGKVLALLQHRKHSQYWVLLPKHTAISLPDDSLSIRVEPLDSVDDWILRALLIRAMPRIIGARKGDLERAEADGLFYVTKHKALGKQGSVITTVTVEPWYSQVTQSWRLDIRTITFTPVKAHEDENGQLPPKIAKLPRYELDTLSQEVKRNSNGQYVKRTLWRGRKNRVPAIKLSGEITLESYYRTRLGVLSMFLEDIQRAYGSALQLELNSIQPDEHQTISDKSVKETYSGLLDLMREQPIWISNQSSDPEAGFKLQAELQRLGLEPVHTNQIESNGLNLLLVNNKDSYKTGEPDPYRIARQEYPDTILQSCYPERLTDEAKRHVAEVLVKELLIKSEIQQCKLLLDYPLLPNDAWFITSIRPEGENLRPDAVWPMFFCRVDGRQLSFGSLPEDIREELHVSLGKTQKKQVFSGRERAEVVFWPETGANLIVSDTGAVSLPDEKKLLEWVKEFDRTIAEGIPSDLVKEYCDRHSESPLTEDLRDIFTRHNPLIPARAFREIRYQSKASRHFYDYLAAQGYRLKAGFQAKETGPLSTTTGIWINRSQQLYAAGPVGSASRSQDNFNHVYHVGSNGNGVPEWFWKSLEVWHIRHRGTTVFPYIFKHVREYGERQVKSGLQTPRE